MAAIMNRSSRLDYRELTGAASITPAPYSKLQLDGKATMVERPTPPQGPELAQAYWTTRKPLGEASFARGRGTNPPPESAFLSTEVSGQRYGATPQSPSRKTARSNRCAER
jgi:hypothetical protein